MDKVSFKAALTGVLLLSMTAIASAQRDGFINVGGANLKAKTEAALAQGRAKGSRFWVAYAFDVRPGFVIDHDYSDFKGNAGGNQDTTISLADSTRPGVETRNLGVFLLYEADASAISRVEVYNLERKREYSGYPVYWAGRAGNEESISLLSSLAGQSAQPSVAGRATMAIGLHDDARVAGILKTLAGGLQLPQVRSSAIFWLGRVGGETPFLIDLANSDKESLEIRKQAIFAIGISRDAAAFSTLQKIYGATSSRELKKQVVFAISRDQNNSEPLNFLIKVAGTEPDLEIRKSALFWLGQKAGQRSLEVLGSVVDSNDAETELQKHAVFLISRRPKDEAVPRLIEIAKAHPKAEVRKQAIFWLGRSGDARALELFKEILSR